MESNRGSKKGAEVNGLILSIFTRTFIDYILSRRFLVWVGGASLSCSTNPRGLSLYSTSDPRPYRS